MGELYGGDMAQVMYGRNARHVPAWCYLQNQGPGYVSFVGASRMGAPHPLRYGSEREHVFAVGEIIFRPHVAIATDALRGTGLAGLATGSHDTDEMLANGELIIGTEQMLEQIKSRS
jgi:hypothetical protein